MKNWFISNRLHSIISIFKIIPTANSNTELAFVVSATPQQEAINHTPEAGKSSMSKAKEFVHHHGKRLMGALAITTAMAATEATAQNAATIDPSHYKTPQTAFVIPNLPSWSDYYLSIKAGESIYLTIDGADANSLICYLSAPTRVRSWNPIKLEVWDVGNILVNYTQAWVNKATWLHVNYQADIYDRTPGSTTQNQRPETVWVGAGQNAVLSAGPNMNPTGSTTSWAYSWKNITTWAILSDVNTAYTDSIKTLPRGTYRVITNDGTGTRTADTIAVLEKPNLDNATRTLNFPSTTAGVLYKVYKAGAWNTWTEIPGLAFTGDGNTRAVILDAANVGNKDVIKLGVQRTAATPVETNLPAIQADFTTDVVAVVPETVQFTQQNRELFRDKPVPSILYSIDGREIGTGISNHVTIPAEVPAGICIVRYTENGQLRAKKIVIK